MHWETRGTLTTASALGTAGGTQRKRKAAHAHMWRSWLRHHGGVQAQPVVIAFGGRT